MAILVMTIVRQSFTPCACVWGKYTNNGDPIPLIQSYLLQYHIARNNIIVINTLLHIILRVHLHFVQYPQIQPLVGVYLSHHLYTHDSIVFDDVMKLGMHMLTLIIW